MLADTSFMELSVASREGLTSPKSVGMVAWTMARFLLVAIGVAAVHFVAWLLTLGAVYAEAFGTARWWTVLLERLFVPLGFPATFIIGRWTPGLVGLPNRTFFSLTIGTSLLWGTAIALLWQWWCLRRTRGSRTAGEV